MRQHLPRGARAAPIDPDLLAAQALAFMADDPDRLGVFLSLTGLTPDSLRESAGGAGFARGVLTHVMADEGLLIDLAAHLGLPPSAIDQAARQVLGHDDG